jgi:hypothetical protein
VTPVERLTYVLRFHRPGRTAAAEADAPATAPGLTVTTRLEGGEVTSSLEPLDGATASLEVSYTVDKDGIHFTESGTVTFGDASASSLTFKSVDEGSLLGGPDGDGFTAGVVSYAIEGGSGALEHASGAICSNFLVNLDTDELIDTHLGIVRLA